MNVLGSEMKDVHTGTGAGETGWKREESGKGRTACKGKEAVLKWEWTVETKGQNRGGGEVEFGRKSGTTSGRR